ncbi:MAG: carbohydrate ABC transporter permease [Clostridiaceae bacterium]|nr:carbohydrate ABC transporter permease [Clostridiaceae bacterium]
MFTDIKKHLKKVLNFIIMLVLIVCAIFPIYWMVSLAFRDSAELASNLSLIPQSFTLENFKILFEQNNFAQALSNSLLITVVSLFISLLLGIPAAYGLARTRFKYRIRNISLFWVLLVRVIPPITFSIPLYFIFNYLEWEHTYWPIILSHVLLSLPLIIWYLMSSVNGLSEEIEESARIDGANEYQIFWHVVLIRLLPAISAVAILTFMTSWNEYLFAVIFIRDTNKFTVPLLLSIMNTEQELTQWGQIAVGGLISIIPVVIFVIFAQAFLKNELSKGGVKG